MKRLSFVVAIAAIAAVCVLFGLRRVGRSATAEEIMVRQVLVPKIEALRSDIGRYPTDKEGLDLLLHPPRDETLKKMWHGPYLDLGSLRLLKDPWGMPYQYEFPGTRSGTAFDVFSFGPDKIRSADDIGNW
jgi:general secretion pathway protein G